MAIKTPTLEQVSLSSDSTFSSLTGLEGKSKTPTFPTLDQINNTPSTEGNVSGFYGGSSTGLNPDEFPFQLKTNSDNVEMRAQDQSIGQEIAYGAGRFVGTTATKFLEGFGYMYGMGEALFTGKSLGEAVDNGWVNLFSSLEEDIKGAMPIYHTNKYNEGNILEQMGTLGFYMDDGVDGLAFLASALLGSKGISMAGKAVGAYGKLARAFSKATIAARTGKASTRILPKLASYAREADLLTMSSLNSAVEASFEAKDTMDNLISQGMSREDAAKAAQGTFWWNMVALMPSNYITNSMFFGKANPIKNRIKNIVGKDGKLISEVAPLTTGQKVGAFASNMTKSMVSEGPYEENIQLAIQNYFQDLTTGKESRGQVEGIGSNWWKNFSTDEGQKAIVLGSLIGMIPGGVGGLRELKADHINESSLHSMLSTTINSINKDLHDQDIWEKDKKGNIIYNEKTKEPVIDPLKVANYFAARYYSGKNAFMTMVATTAGNQIMADRLEEERIASLAYAFLSSPDGQKAFEAQVDLYAQEKIQSMTEKGEEVDPAAVKKLAQEYKDKGALYQVLYNNVEEAYGGLYNFHSPVFPGKNDAKISNLANMTKDTAMKTQYMVGVDQMFWQQKIKELEAEKSKIEMSPAGQTDLGKNSVASIEKHIKAVEETLEKAQESYKKALDIKMWQDKFNTSKKELMDLLEETEEGVTPEVPEEEVPEEETKTPEELAKEEEERGTITPHDKTVQEEVKAAAERVAEDLDIEVQLEAKKKSALEELESAYTTNMSADALEEVQRKVTTEALISRYGDRGRSEKTLKGLVDSAEEGETIEAIYQDVTGTIYVDKETNEIIFKANESGKEHILGKTTDESIVPVSAYGIVPLKHTIFDVSLAEDGVGMVIQGRRYNIDNDKPLSLIEHDEKGMPVAVTLKDVNGVSLRFTNPTLVVDIAYSLELLDAAREATFNEYLNTLEADFVVVHNPKSTDSSAKYYIYYMPDGSKEVVRPTTTTDPDGTLRFVNKKVVNKKFRQILIDAHMKDIHTLMERRIAERINLNNKDANEKLAELKKKLEDEINEFVRYSRSATEKEIISALGLTEVSTAAAEEAEKDGRQDVDETTKRDNKSPRGQAETTTVVKKKKTKEEKEILDAKAEEIATEKPVEKPKGKVVDSLGVEPTNEETLEKEEVEESSDPKHGLAHSATAVAWKAEDNPDLDNFLSNPDNVLDGYTLSASIDYEYSDEDWNENSKKIDYINKYINTLRKGDEDAFDSLIDVIAIKLTLVDENGKEMPYKGMYLHRSDFDNIVVPKELQLRKSSMHPTEYQKEVDAIVETEMKATRALRKEIIKDLLANKPVTFSGLSRGKGVLSQTRGQNRSLTEITDSPDNGRLGSANNEHIIMDGQGEIIPGDGSTGNVFWETDETVNGDKFAVKLNVSKIAEEHAKILLKAFQTAVNSKGGYSSVYEGPEVEGDLTVGEIISILALEGPITNQYDKETNWLVQPHLIPKTLYMKDRVLYFGEQSLKLTKKISDEDVAAFVKHITTNKNYNIPYSTHVKSGVGLGTKVKKDFKIGSLVGKKGMSYQSFLILNNMIMTDLIKDSVTGRIFSKPVLMFEHTPKKKKAAPKAPAKEEVVENKVSKSEKAASQAVSDAVRGKDYKEIRRASDFEGVPEGTDIFTVIGGRSENDDGTSGEDVGESISVIGVTERGEDGKMIFRVSPKLSDTKESMEALQYLDGIELSNEKIERLDTIFKGRSIHVEVLANQPETVTKSNALSRAELAKKLNNMEEEDDMPLESNKVSSEEDLYNLAIKYNLVTREKVDEEYVPRPGRLAKYLSEGSSAYYTSGEGLKLSREQKLELQNLAYKITKSNNQDEVPFAHSTEFSTGKKGDIATAVKYLKNKFGKEVAIKIEEGLIPVITKSGTKMAFATFQRDVITLSKALEQGSEYEEAFHRVSLLYLSPEQQKLIHDEARTKYGLKEATDREINERLAQDYRESEIEGGKVKQTIGKRIANFFRDLYDFIHTFFTGRLRISKLDVDNLFRVISKSNGRVGRIRYARPNTASYKKLKGADAYTHAVKGRELEYIHDTETLTHVVKNLVNIMITKSGVYKTKDIDKLDYMSAYVDMKRRVKIAKESGADDVAALYQEIVDNYDVFQDLMKSQLETLGIRTKLPEDAENEEDARGFNFNRYDKASFELDGKDNAGTAVKFVIATLHSTDLVNGTTLLREFVDYDTMFETFQQELSHLSTLEEMLKQVETKKTIPYKELAERIKRDRAVDKFDTLATQFYHAMRKNRYKYKNAVANLKGGRAEIEILDAETQKASNAQSTVWGQAFMSSEAYKEGEPNIPFLKSITADFANITTKANTEYNNKANNKTLPSYDTLFNDVLKLFNKVSVPMDAVVLNNILDGIDANDKHAALYNFLFHSKISKMGAIFGSKGIFTKLASEGKVTNSRGAVMSNDRIFTNEQLFTKVIAPAFLEVHGGMVTNTILGPDGNPYYLLSENSFITDLFHSLRNNPAFFNSLANDVEYNEHSYLLKQMVSPAVRSNLEVVVFSALSIKNSGDKGRSYADISDAEDLLVKMGMFESGLVVLPQLADRGNLYSLSGLKPLDFDYKVDKDGKLTLPKEIVDIFWGYALDELHQIKRITQEIENARTKGTTDSLKENVHFKLNKKGERVYEDANGYKWQHFTDFNGKNVTEANLRGLVEKVLKDRIEDGLRFLDKAKIINVFENDKGAITNVTNGMLDDTAIKKKAKESFNDSQPSAIRNKVANFTLNSIMATIEAEKIIFMSPVYYKNLEDKIKRYTAIASTGTVSRLAIPRDTMKGDRLLHSNDKFNYSILATQTYDAKKLREELKPKFVAKYMLNGATVAEAERRAEKSLSGFMEVDPSDGQAYITPEMFRALHIRLGEWNDIKEEAYKLLSVTDRELTKKEQSAMDELFMQPLKFGYFGPIINPGSMSPLYFKMSLATLTPRLVKGTMLQALYDSMTDNNNPKDMVLFDTAVKEGIGLKTTYYSEDANGEPITDSPNTADIIDMPSSVANFQYLRKQVVTDPHNELRTLVGTQFRKVALSNIIDDQTYIVGNKKVKGSKLKEDNKDLMSELSDRGVDEFLKVLGIDDDTYLSNDPDKMYDMIRSKARMSGMPDAFIDAFSKQEDGERYEPDALPDRKWVQSSLLSMLAKKSVELHLPGTSLIQMTNFGLRKYDEDDSLKLIDENGFMEAKVSIEVFRDAIPNYQNLTYKQREAYVHAQFSGVGYRIPTQGLVSTVPLKIVGFLPETSTATIVLPSEFTRLTGSDFDIDKLYFVRHNYSVVDGKPKRVSFLTTDNSTLEERLEVFSHEAIAFEAKSARKANLEVLKEFFGRRDEASSEIRSIKSETDNLLDTDEEVDMSSPEFIKKRDELRKKYNKVIQQEDNIKDVISKIRQETEDEIEVMRKAWIKSNYKSFGKLSEIRQNTKKALENRLLDSYFAVLKSNDHVIDNYQPLDATTTLLKGLADDISVWEGNDTALPSLYSASFMYQSEVKHKYLWGKKGIGPFARANVHHVLGQIAGIHLGNYIGVGNTKEFDGRQVTDLSQVYGQDGEAILDWMSALINAHVDVAKEPYIFYLNVNSSTYSVGELLVRAGAGENAFLFLAQPILKEYAQAHSNSRGKIRPSKTKPLSEIKTKYRNLQASAVRKENRRGKIFVKEGIFNTKRLKKDIHKSTLKDSDFYTRQLQILDKFSELNKTGQFLFESVEAVQIDTKKFGKNLAELRRFNRLKNKVLNDNVIKNMDVMFENTFLGAYFDNSVVLGLTLFKDTTVMASDAIVALSDRIMDEIGRRTDISKNAVYQLNNINDEIFAAITGRFIVNDLGYDEDVLEGMLYGKDSMVSRLNSIKNNPKYAGNPLIKLLQPSMSFKNVAPNFIITFTATDTKTKWAKDRIIDGWSELLTSNDPEISRFAKDLVAYSFFTSGFKKTLYSIFNYIPPAYLKEIGFSEYIGNMRRDFNDTSNYDLLEGVHDDVFQNLWSEDDIVPNVPDSEFNNKRRPGSKSGWGEKYPTHVSMSNKASEELALGLNSIGEVIYKPFIKTTISKTKLLYKFVGYLTDENGKSEPVYELSQRKGYSDAGKVVKEHGLTKSIIPTNNTRQLPGGWTHEMETRDVFGTMKFEGEPEKEQITYNFSGFKSIQPEDMTIVELFEGDVDDTLEEFEDKYAEPTETVEEKPSLLDGLTQQKIDEVKDAHKDCKLG